MKLYGAIDIGGTNARVALYNEKGQKIDHFKTTTDINNFKPTLDAVCDFIKKHKNVAGIGMSIPGPADYEQGKLLDLPNMPGWVKLDVRTEMIKRTGIENILFANDANLMALAHHFYFKGTEKDVTQFFTVSTGLGVGLIINNHFFTGSTGQAQEVATAPLSWIRKDGKGLSEGSLELFSAGSGIEYWGKQVGYATTKDVFDKYNKDAKATEIIDNGIDTLANAIATVIVFMNPNKIIFDGSVARNNPWYVDEAIKRAKPMVFASQYDPIEFYHAELGDDAALIGAFYYIKEEGK